MIQNLLIIGAGIYGLVAKEVAERMGYFLRIDFVDDRAKVTPDGTPVIGTTQDLAELSKRYANVVVAIGNPEVRQKLIRFIEEETLLRLVTLVSPMLKVLLYQIEKMFLMGLYGPIQLDGQEYCFKDGM